ncbi:MAG: zinc-binding dehydrogenase [Candidatus Bathyarchaeota archaeon]|nr:MAG: zinc-binding dehydrogenase [Candidatus Bathyarchaeota archaeon]
MKAALLFQREKASLKPGEPVTELRVVEIDKPKIEKNDILVKVRACSVCPTDYRKYITGNHGVNEWPFNPGHEWAGDVVEVGTEVENFEVGDRIKGMGYAGYAEYAKIVGRYRQWGNIAVRPFALCDKLPDNVTYEEGGIATPLAECLESIINVCKVKMFDNVAIIGAGPMGLMNAMVAKAIGATVFVSEILEHRLKLAEELEMDYVVNPNEEDPVEFVKKHTGGMGADSVVCSIGHPIVIEQGLKMARRGAIVNIFGGATAETRVNFNPNLIHYGVLNLTASYGTGGHWDLGAKALRLISSGRIDVKKIVTARYPLDRTLDALKHVGSKEGMKSILYPDPKDIPKS